MKRFAGILALAAVLGAPAWADTIYLNNGVRFDGVVTPVPEHEGLYRVTAGERTLVYREAEIARIEKNDRTGRLDKDDLRARWEEKNARLTEETGLTAEQRRQVRGLMFQLKTDNVPERIAIRERLIQLQREFDAYGYLRMLYAELSILLAPNVLETLYYMDPARSVDLLRESAERNYFGVRAMALELLGRLQDGASASLIARGLADHQQPVQISASYVLARLDVKEATPALIELLAHPDRRVANASRESLHSLWDGAWGDEPPRSVDEWETFWRGRSTQGAPITLATLEPLSPEEDEFTRSFDSNH